MALAEVLSQRSSTRGTSQVTTETPTQASRSVTVTGPVVTTTETQPATETTTTTTRTAATQEASTPFHAGIAFSFKIGLRNRQSAA